MTPRDMVVFISVFRTGSTTRAADELHLSQSAVSKTIKTLEQELETVLFERIRKRLMPTEAGNLLYGYAVSIDDIYKRMHHELDHWDSMRIFRIGATPTPGCILLPESIRQFKDRHSTCSLSITVDSSDKLCRMLENNELDFALIEGKITSNALEHETLTEDRLVLIIPPGHRLASAERITLSDLEGYPIILREKGSSSRRQVEKAFFRMGVPLNRVMESINNHAIVACVRENIGLAFLPEQLARSSARFGHVVYKEVADAELTRRIHFVWHRDRLLSRPIQDYMEICRNICESLDDDPPPMP